MGNGFTLMKPPVGCEESFPVAVIKHCGKGNLRESHSGSQTSSNGDAKSAGT